MSTKGERIFEAVLSSIKDDGHMGKPHLTDQDNEMIILTGLTPEQWNEEEEE